jgi:hypothetical protein
VGYELDVPVDYAVFKRNASGFVVKSRQRGKTNHVAFKAIADHGKNPQVHIHLGYMGYSDERGNEGSIDVDFYIDESHIQDLLIQMHRLKAEFQHMTEE